MIPERVILARLFADDTYVFGGTTVLLIVVVLLLAVLVALTFRRR